MKYRKKQEIVDAFIWTADVDQEEDPLWVVEAIKSEIISFQHIETPECRMLIDYGGIIMTASRGDYIVKDATGKILSYEPDMFALRYDEIKAPVGRE